MYSTTRHLLAWLQEQHATQLSVELQRNDRNDLCASGDDAAAAAAAAEAADETCTGGPVSRLPAPAFIRPVCLIRPPRMLGVLAQKAQM